MDRRSKIEWRRESDSISRTVFAIFGCINCIHISFVSSKTEKVCFHTHILQCAVNRPYRMPFSISIRFQKGEPSEQPALLFESVTRDDADKSVSLLIKYLFNYGFYKFGIEMTLIMLVTLISFRKDTVSVVYVIWLCAICGVRRRTKKFIWPIFLYFVLIATVVQYVIMLNLPSFLYWSE